VTTKLRGTECSKDTLVGSCPKAIKHNVDKQGSTKNTLSDRIQSDKSKPQTAVS